MNEKDSEDKYPVSTIEKFLELQTKELGIRAQEASLKEKDLSASWEYAKDALAAQERDRKHIREHRKSFLNGCLLLGGIVMAFATGVLALAIIYDRAELVRDALQILISLVGGYSLGYARIGAGLINKESPLDTHYGDEP